MFDEREAVVLEVRPWDVHGVPHVDVTVAYRDRQVETARLGAESAPLDLAPGEEVRVKLVMRTIVAIERAPFSPSDPAP
jgi:hypothetical protein